MSAREEESTNGGRPPRPVPGRLGSEDGALGVVLVGADRAADEVTARVKATLLLASLGLWVLAAAIVKGWFG